MSPDKKPISRVTRTKENARISYDRMSKWYDLMAGSSEWKFVKVGLELLNASQGEAILDLGYGTGKSVLAIARSVGANGRVCGIDLSDGMQKIASGRVEAAGLSERVALKCGDAAKLPFEDESFDAVFTSFTLELFDTPEIPRVLGECYRVLKSDGRIVVVAMAKKTPESFAVKIYEWAHEKLPNYVDCRPIYALESLADAGLQIVEVKEVKMWGLPVSVVLGRKV